MPGLGDLKKIQGSEKCRVSELERTSEVTQSSLANVSPTLRNPDRWAVTLGSVGSTDTLFYETSQSSIRDLTANAYSS